MHQLAELLSLVVRVDAIVDIKCNQISKHAAVGFSVHRLPIYFTRISANPRALLGPPATAAAYQQSAGTHARAGETRSNL